jgi:hypothetical protein
MPCVNIGAETSKEKLPAHPCAIADGTCQLKFVVVSKAMSRRVLKDLCG